VEGAMQGAKELRIEKRRTWPSATARGVRTRRVAVICHKKTMSEKKKIEFYGGSAVGLVPFLVFLAGTVYICIMGAPTETGMALFALVGLLVGAFFAKNKWDYSEEIFVGMANPVAVVPVLCWLIAGFFGAILKSAGLVNGLVWLASKANISGALFCVAAFVICAVYACATGTSMGTIIPCMSVIYPTGVIVGANPVVLAVLLAPMAHLLECCGVLSFIREKLIGKLITTRKKAEVSVLAIMAIFDTLINFSTVAMLAAGPSLIKEIGKKFNISGVRLANLMDCSACTASYLLPYMVPLVAVMTVSGEVAEAFPGVVPQVTANQAMFTAFYPIVMIFTVLFMALTGWGRKGEKDA